MDDSDLSSLVDSLKNDARQIENQRAFDLLKSKYLGPKSSIKKSLQSLSAFQGAEKAEKSRLFNYYRSQLQEALADIKADLDQKLIQKALLDGKVDSSLGANFRHIGSTHPLRHIEIKIRSVMQSIGFYAAEGPEIESEYYNFTALNTPKNHPAATLQDTFYLKNGQLLRSHTSPVQVRMMETYQPPLNVYTIGRVFRADTPDATHSPCFHQLEGLIVDEKTSLQDLVQTLSFIMESLFGQKLDMRFRPSYFPFTEPSLECDIYFKGKWMEVLGCGLVHPNVLRMSHVDAERFKGFAFGMGLERLAMLYYQIDDIRLFYEGDIDFLRQFEQAEAF